MISFLKKEYSFCDVKVRKTKRLRTISLRVKEGKAELLCPFFTSNRQIQSIINKKKVWIQKKIHEQNSQKQSLENLLKNGKIIFLGKEIGVLQKKSSLKMVCMVKNNLIISSKESSFKNLKNLVINWYIEKSEQYLKERVGFISKKIKIPLKRVYIKNYKARWGACSLSGDIYLNWKLIILPKKIIDYVIVHEFCHIEEHNHSKKFWDLMLKFMPDYKSKDLWLKKNGTAVILFS